MIELEKIIEELEKLSLEDLELLKGKIKKCIDAKSDKKKMVIYKCDCFDSSDYHFNKYKHYAKVLTGIDCTETNGYAFQGEFISVRKENLIQDGSYIIENCNYHLYLYKLESDEKNLCLEGSTNKIISFIKKAKEITGY